MKGRSEDKYILNQCDYALLKSRIISFMKKDPNGDSNGCYKITSMYFDDCNFQCASDTEAGAGKRFKYRIRFYNDDTNDLILEKKAKTKNIGYKESTHISYDVYKKILNEDYYKLIYEDDKVLREFALFSIIRRARPSCIISYNREAYVNKLTNTRITFDSNISVSVDVDNFINKPSISIPVIDEDKRILEIKYDGKLEPFIKDMLKKPNIVQTSFSKYFLGYSIIKGAYKYEYIKYAN